MCFSDQRLEEEADDLVAVTLRWEDEKVPLELTICKVEISEMKMIFSGAATFAFRNICSLVQKHSGCRKCRRRTRMPPKTPG